VLYFVFGVTVSDLNYVNFAAQPAGQESIDHWLIAGWSICRSNRSCKAISTSSISGIHTCNKVSSVMRRDDSWPATVPSVMPTGDCSHWSIHYIHKANRLISVWMGKVPTRKHPGWRNRIEDRESDGRFWIGNPGFLFEFISLSFEDKPIRVSNRLTDNADHYYSWPHIMAGQLITCPTFHGTLAGSRTRDLIITSPLPCCATTPHFVHV